MPDQIFRRCTKNGLPLLYTVDMISFTGYLLQRTLDESERTTGGRLDADREVALRNMCKEPEDIRKAADFMMHATGIKNPARATSEYLSKNPNWREDLWKALRGSSQGSEEPRKFDEF